MKTTQKTDNKKTDADFTKALAKGKLTNEDLISFINSGLDISLLNRELYWDKSTLLHNAVENQHIKTVKILLEAGADMNLCDTWGRTPLHIAAARGDTEMVKLLLEAGADLNYRNNKGETAIFSAAECHSTTETITLLADAGADINAQDNCGRTALSSAVLCRNKNAVKILLDMGCSPDIPGRDRAPAIADAVVNGSGEIVEMMVNAGAKFLNAGLNGEDLILRAVYYGELESAKILLEHGSDPNAKDSADNYALISAISSENPGIIKLLLEAGADIDVKSGKLGTTALIEAARYAKSTAAKMLLEHGTDPNITDNAGETPLISAIPEYAGEACRKRLKIISMLVEAGGGLDTQNRWKRTALHKAAFSGYVSIIKKLLKYGADPEIPDFHGNTAFDILKKNHSDLYEKNIQALTALLYKNRHLKEEDARKRVRTDYEFDI